MIFFGGLKIEWNDRTVRVEHKDAALLVTRVVGAEWFSEKVSDAARTAEKKRIEAAAVKALQALYEHKYRLRGKK